MNAHANVIRFPTVTRPAAIRRPRLLVAAAQAGLAGWRRGRDLRRLLGTDELPHPAHSLSCLHELEARQDLARRSGGAGYDLKRHILLLTAILGETRENLGFQAPVNAPGRASRTRL